MHAYTFRWLHPQAASVGPWQALARTKQYRLLQSKQRHLPVMQQGWVLERKIDREDPRAEWRWAWCELIVLRYWRMQCLLSRQHQRLKHHTHTRPNVPSKQLSLNTRKFPFRRGSSQCMRRSSDRYIRRESGRSSLCVCVYGVYVYLSVCVCVWVCVCGHKSTSYIHNEKVMSTRKRKEFNYRWQHCLVPWHTVPDRLSRTVVLYVLLHEKVGWTFCWIAEAAEWQAVL